MLKCQNLKKQLVDYYTKVTTPKENYECQKYKNDNIQKQRVERLSLSVVVTCKGIRSLSVSSTVAIYSHTNPFSVHTSFTLRTRTRFVGQITIHSPNRMCLRYHLHFASLHRMQTDHLNTHTHATTCT